MSKSNESQAGVIDLLDEPSVNAKKVRPAVTDTGTATRFAPEHKAAGPNLLPILSVLSDRPVPDVVADLDGKGYGALKGEVAEPVTAFTTPFREATQRCLD